MGLLEKWVKHCQSNELTHKTSPSVFILLIIGQIIFLFLFATWLDSTFNTKHIGNTYYFTNISLICVCCHWLSFIPSYIYSTDNIFDITGEITFLVTIIYSLSQIEIYSIRNMAVNGMCTLWVIRLGVFLFIRILNRGKDFRFKQMKYYFAYYLFAFTAQALWVFLQGMCLYLLNYHSALHSKSVFVSFSILDYFGFIVFVIGFAIEIISDYQKYVFNRKFKSGRNVNFIKNGLWKYSRHPNYVGEITLWIGITIICMNELYATAKLPFLALILAAISPIWSAFFLVSTSLMLIEKEGDERFHRNRKYLLYKKQVSILFPHCC